MSNQTLRDEIANDPLTRGYSSMTDAEVAADLNTDYRTRQRSGMSGGEVFNETDATEFAALTDTDKDRWLSLCGVDVLDPYGPAVEVATDIFSAGSATLTALGAAREESISRADELGLGDVKPYDVAKARDQLGVS